MKLVKLVAPVGHGRAEFSVSMIAAAPADAFAFELLEKAGVGVAPGVDFGQAGKRAVRFSYASSEENIREAARRLREYLRKTNSIERAIAGARFFASRLGADVVAMRCRVVKRCFAAEEGQPHELMATLDQDVTVIDPREAEAALRREFEGVRPGRDAKRAAAEFLERRIKSKEDVPWSRISPGPRGGVNGGRNPSIAGGFR